MTAPRLRQPRPVVADNAASASATPGDQVDKAMRERLHARLAVLRRGSEVRGRMTAAIEAEASESDAERLLGDLDRRLDFVINQPGLSDRPIEEVIAEIRRDMGLAPGVAAADKVKAADVEGSDEHGVGEDDQDGEKSGAEAAQSPPRCWSG